MTAREPWRIKSLGVGGLTMRFSGRTKARSALCLENLGGGFGKVYDVGLQAVCGSPISPTALYDCGMDLADGWREACEDAIAASKALGYTPTVWISMIREMGAVEAAKKLLRADPFQTGFDRLHKLGRLDLTIEWAVLHPRWDALFDRDDRGSAHWRLTMAIQGRLAAP